MLQWGRGFEAAETSSANTRIRLLIGLQWGRGFEAAETSKENETLWPRCAGFNGAAVLRPRKLVGDGSQRVVCMLLQWGRGFEAAETAFANSSSNVICGLQWGRGFEAAETGEMLAWLNRDRRFNGAAVLRPRKRGLANVAPPRGGVASMGPRF